MKSISVVILSIAGLIAVISATPHRNQMGKRAMGHSSKMQESVIGANGSLHVPAHYRTSYQFLGSWAIAADKGGQGSKSLHVVYGSPGAIAAYRRDGRFPDGSVLIKEVYDAATQTMTTGTVSRAEKLKGWFVMVKESKDTHPGNQLWGDGWAWSWFDAGNRSKTTSTNYRLDCLSCHEPARPTDLVYVQGYPPLSRAN